MNTHGTNPLVADTDGDSYSDGEEIVGGSDPLDPESFPPSVPFAGAWAYGVLAAMLLAAGYVRSQSLRRRVSIDG